MICLLPLPHVQSVIKSYWLTCLTYFCNISETYSLSSIPTSIFLPTWTLGISAKQGLLCPLLSSQPNVVRDIAKVVFLKHEISPFRYFHWTPDVHRTSHRARPLGLIWKSSHPCISPDLIISQDLIIIPCRYLVAQPNWNDHVHTHPVVCCLHSCWLCSSLSSESSSHFVIHCEGLCTLQALLRYFFHKGVPAPPSSCRHVPCTHHSPLYLYLL